MSNPGQRRRLRPGNEAQPRHRSVGMTVTQKAAGVAGRGSGADLGIGRDGNGSSDMDWKNGTQMTRIGRIGAG